MTIIQKYITVKSNLVAACKAQEEWCQKDVDCESW